MVIDGVQLLLQLIQPRIQPLRPLRIPGIQSLPALVPEIAALLLEVKPLPQQIVPLLPCILQLPVHFLQLLIQLRKCLIKFFSVHEIIPFSPSSVSNARFC